MVNELVDNGEGTMLGIRAQFPELHLRVLVERRDTRVNGNATFGWLRQRGEASTKLMFLALVGFQGRGCNDGVPPEFCHLLLLKALLFQWPSK